MGSEDRNHRGVVGVDSRDNRNVVLELIELVGGCWCYGDSIVERIDKGGVVRAEGHFADNVREVECCR